jgi:hypothetical protein
MSALSTQLLLQRRLKKLTGGGASLTANSVTTSNIINRTIIGGDIALGTIKGENIEVGTIESGYLDPAFLTYLTNLENKVLLLEQTAVIRSFDTLVGSPTPVNNFSIPIDLVNNESVEIDLTLKINGTGHTNLFVRANTATQINKSWDEWIGYWWEPVTNPPTIAYTRTDQEGLTLVFVEHNNRTANIKIKIYRSFDINTASSQYIIELEGSYRRINVGITKSEMSGVASSFIPTGLYFSMNQTMTASYSIINDKRRTFYNSILS